MCLVADRTLWRTRQSPFRWARRSSAFFLCRSMEKLTACPLDAQGKRRVGRFRNIARRPGQDWQDDGSAFPRDPVTSREWLDRLLATLLSPSGWSANVRLSGRAARFATAHHARAADGNGNRMTGWPGWTGLNRGSVSHAGALPQRARNEGNGRSGRHAPRDVSPTFVRPRRPAPRRRGGHLLNPANPGHPVSLFRRSRTEHSVLAIA